MTTEIYNVGSGYRVIIGNLFRNNDLVINGNGTDANVVIESSSIFNFNIPTTLSGSVNGVGPIRNGFNATLIHSGVTFAGTTGNETFDASKYYNNVKFNGGAGVNTLKGAHGANVFTHDYANGGTDTIVGGKTETVNWKLLFLNYSKTYTATNDLVVNGTDNADIFRLVGNSNDAVNVFDTLRTDTTTPARIKATELGADAKIQLNGNRGDDTADLRAFKGTVKFNGGDGDDSLQFQHGTSGAGSHYNGGENRDSLQVFAQGTGSNLKLTNAALTDEGDASKTLLTLHSVEASGFNGGNGDDTFNASAFGGQVVTNLGGGRNVFHSSEANNNLVTRTLSNEGHDTVHGNLAYTTNLRIQGTALADNLVFAGEANTFTVKHNGTEVIDAENVRGSITFNGGAENDTANLRSFKGAVTFNGDAGNDLLEFQHGVSGAGSKFDGGADRDTVRLYAQASGTNITLSDTALKDIGDNGKVLIGLANVEVASLLGGAGDDVFDARESTAQVVTRLGGGDNVFHSSNANNNHVTHSLANTTAHDTLNGFNGKTTNLVIEGASNGNNVKFAGTTTDYTVTNFGREVIKANDVQGTSNLNAAPIEVKGGFGGDTVDVTDFAGRLWFNAGDGGDTLVFKDDFSGANTRFNGEDGFDTLIVKARDGGSTLFVDGTTAEGSLKNASNTTLVAFKSVEKVVFDGSASADNFDASLYAGEVKLNGGAGNDVLKASNGGSEITGGKGADDITLGAGADEVFYLNKGDSTFAARDTVTGFNLIQDKLVFDEGEVQDNGTLYLFGFIPTAEFKNGVVQFANNGFGDAAKGLFNDLSLQAATTAVAAFAANQAIVAFEHKGASYVVDYGDGIAVDNIVQLAGVNLAGANLDDFVNIV